MTQSDLPLEKSPGSRMWGVGSSVGEGKGAATLCMGNSKDLDQGRAAGGKKWQSKQAYSIKLGFAVKGRVHNFHLPRS